MKKNTQRKSVIKSGPAAHCLQNQTHKCQQKGKLSLIRMLAIWGDGGPTVPQKTPLRILLGHEILKVRREVISVNH